MQWRETMTFRKLLTKTLVCSSLTLSCISPSFAAGDALEKVTFQLDWLPGGNKAPVYVGQQLGYFRDAGLEVDISPGRGSTDAITKLATGTSDIGMADISALMAAKAKSAVPVVAVMSIFSQAPHVFFTLKSSGIDSVDDVKGKTIATSPFTSSNIFLPLLLAKYQLDESDITLLKADAAALAPMLITGRSDVIIAWLSDVQKYQAMAKKVGKELNVIPWHDAGLKMYSTALVASERFLNERPATAKRFTAAFKKALEYTWAHPEKAAAMLNKAVPEVNSRIAADSITSLTPLIYNESSHTHGLGVFAADRLEDTWNSVATAQQLDHKSLQAESAISRDFLPEQ
jgi:NitT/TauT family transport system substrate-binding protein